MSTMVQKGVVSNMGSLTTVSMILVTVGAINWGLVGLLDLNLVTMLLGEGSMLTKVVYILVGLAGVHSLYTGVMKK